MTSKLELPCNTGRRLTISRRKLRLLGLGKELSVISVEGAIGSITWDRLQEVTKKDKVVARLTEGIQRRIPYCSNVMIPRQYHKYSYGPSWLSWMELCATKTGWLYRMIYREWFWERCIL